jgi:hypothetical protein
VLRHNKVNEKELMALDAFDSQGKVLPGSVGVKAKSPSNNSVSVLAIITIILAMLMIASERGSDAQILFGLVAFCAFIALLLGLIFSAFKVK